MLGGSSLWVRGALLDLSSAASRECRVMRMYLGSSHTSYPVFEGPTMYVYRQPEYLWVRVSIVVPLLGWVAL